MSKRIHLLACGDADRPYQIVTKEEYLAAERGAGFHSKYGHEYATGGFSSGGIRGTYVDPGDPRYEEYLAQIPTHVDCKASTNQRTCDYETALHELYRLVYKVTFQLHMSPEFKQWKERWEHVL